jgi:hypothetical protein
MLALVVQHIHRHKLTTKEFFRSAYLWRFGRDCLDISLANDAKRFDETGYLPDYVCKFASSIYGVH